MTRSLIPLMLALLGTFVRGDTSVYILSANLEQVVTSSTLQWVSSSNFNESMLSNAVVAAFQIVDDEDNTEDQANGKPVYVCRAKTNAIWVSGQLRPKKRACIVSMYKKVSHHDNFEILINIENSARLSWVFKNVYTSSSQGGVTSGEGREGTLRTFVARRQANSHNKPGSLTYNVGKFNPTENLGMFDVVDQNNEELKFEDGEILVETEPISYEIKSVKFDRIRSRHNKKLRILGHAVLKNPESGLQRVDTVITYNYTHSIYWGKGHGLLTGLNFTVLLSNGTKTGNWAITKTENKWESQTIEKYLEEGTAVNVTLYGNYTESDVPYTATVVALYKDKETMSRLLSDSKREHWMSDVYIDFGPVYFLHNNSHVPTTTTTTTTTTTSATTSKKSTTHKVVPLDIPHVVQIGNSKKQSDEASSIKIHENSSMMSDASNAEAEVATTTKKNSHQSSASTKVLVDLVVLGVMAMVTRRVT